jgi:hypothetical protein
MNEEQRRAWEEIERQLGAESRENRTALARIFESGGVEKARARAHVDKMFSGLFTAGAYDTYAALLRGLGSSEEVVLRAVKTEIVRRGWSVGAFWDAVKKTGVTVAPETVVAALKEVDEHYRRRIRDHYDDIPF